MLKVNKTYEKAPYIKTFDKELKVIDGVKQEVYSERVEDPYEGVKATDFSLQSLIDADAADLLQPVGTLSRGQFTIADFAGYCADYLSNIAGDLENNEVKNDEK